MRTPLLDGLAEARALLGKGQALGRPRKQIKRARGLIKRAALAVGHGKPCDGSRAYSAGLRGLGSAKHGIDAAFVNGRRRVARKRAPGDDVSPAQIALALLDLKRALAAAEFAHARAAGPAFSKPCGALRHTFAIRSKVVETDDAAGVVRLAGGRELVLAEGGRWRGPLVEGASVRVKGVGFKDGSGVATDTSPSAGARDARPSCSRQVPRAPDRAGPGLPAVRERGADHAATTLPRTAAPTTSTGSSWGCEWA